MAHRARCTLLICLVLLVFVASASSVSAHAGPLWSNKPAVYLLLALAPLVLLVHLLFERVMLRRFLKTVGIAVGEEPLVTALRLGGAIYTRAIRATDDPIFLLRVLRPLGGTPLSVLRLGGCCSGISRLYIVCLDLLGIRAAQVTLYHVTGHAQHCMVEVALPNRRLLIDPTYGFEFQSTVGEPLGIKDLRAGAIPRFSSLPGSNTSAYPDDDDYYQFAFAETRTANWTQTTLRRAVYRTLRRMSGDWIDCMRLHPLLEWPQVLLLGVLTALFAAMGLVHWVLSVAQ
jgi:hypothetical protein